MFRNIVLTLTVLVALTANANAVVRTFEIINTDTVGTWVTSTAGETSVSYDAAELIANGITFADAGTFVTNDHPGFSSDTFELSSIAYLGSSPSASLRFEFDNPEGEFLRVNLPPSTLFDTSADIPDFEMAYRTAGFNNFGVAVINPGNTVKVGTAAVPEPSAFAFGALGLAVTGLGRWARRRFFS